MGIGRFLRQFIGGREAMRPEMLDRQAFRRQLERERMRSDRSGIGFSLVAFTLTKRDGHHGRQALLWILRRRLRITDDVGLLPDGRIAALLPDTPVSGAWTVADELCRRFAEVYGEAFRPDGRGAKGRRTMTGAAAGRRTVEGEVMDAAPTDFRSIERDSTERDFSERDFSDWGSRDWGCIKCDVYAYPSHGNWRESGDNRRSSTPRSEREESYGDDDQSPHESPDLEPVLAGSRTEGSEGRPVRGLEAMFAQPLPVWKRAIDLVGGSLVLLLAWPVMLAAAVAVKLSSRGPVLFAQRRDGLGGRPFVMYKFRTMIVDAEQQKAALRRFSEQDGPAFKMTNDPRITRTGRLLRATSIDELPQLWNVLRGEMSLVGPRPLPCEESAGCQPWQRRRLDVTPGLTCIWQIAGRSLVSFSEWVRMDLQYVRTRTLGHDLKLLLLTVPAVLLRRGAK